ncbi:MAG: 50S ribosomal protein L34e [Sulfolobales archaeon]
MVRPALRSRSPKRVSRRTPSGKSKVFYGRRDSYNAYCPLCGKPLGGVPKSLKEVRLGFKSRKRPERPYAGMLCPLCLALAYKVAVRSM